MTGDAAERVGQATIASVAAAAGVSKTTVSHVLSGRRPVSSATRASVMAVVEQLRYRPNALARSLTALRSHTVAVLVNDVLNPFYPALARGVQDAVHGSGYVNLLLDAAGDPARVREFLGIALDRRVDGVVLASLEVDGSDVHEVRRAGVPVVAVGVPLHDSIRAEVDVVTSDDRLLAADAVAALVALGHVRIAMICGPQDSSPGALRAAGYRAACTKAGLRVTASMIATGDWTRDGGQQAMSELLTARTPPTAVLCANDLMAIGAVDTCRANGVSVPHDIAVHGIDDIDAASLVTPALSTVHIPATTIGHQAGTLLLERMGAGSVDPEPRHLTIGHQLIKRAST